MSEKNIFEVAVRNRFRFPYKGNSSTEDLWLLSVRELDSVFKILNSELKQVQEESLLEVKTQQDEELALKIEIVKHIVAVKVKEEQERLQLKQKREHKQKIMELIAKKDNESLENMSKEELKAMLNEIE